MGRKMTTLTTPVCNLPICGEWMQFYFFQIKAKGNKNQQITIVFATTVNCLTNRI